MSLISIKTATGPKYWRSLDQLAGTPAFREWVEREFPANAAEMLDAKSRRTVLKLMAASFGLAGLTACRRPVTHVLPYSKGVEDFVPGQAYYYTTAMPLSGQTTGLIVETHDGRPTKIEGNPDHPQSLGAATGLQQASVLDLYDPDRSARVLEGGKESDWKKFEAYLKTVSLGDGSGLRFLTETITSPSLGSLKTAALAKYPKAKWIEYEPIARENGAMLAFGQAVNVEQHFDKAKVILSLDADFLGVDWTTPLATKQFSKRRRVDSEEDLEHVNRLYMVESQFSLTGGNADHRLRMRGSEVAQFAKEVAGALGALPGFNVIGNDKRSKFIGALVKDLKSAGAEVLVVAGPRQPPVVHALAHLMNQSLGSAAVTYSKAANVDGVEALKTLTGEMSNGQVSTLVMLGGNPVYTAPADLQFGLALAKVANSIHLGLEENETTASAKWHLPEAHYLESWSDSPNAIQQPMIEPMYGGKTAAELVAVLIDYKQKRGYDIVKNYWNLPEKAWKQALHDGIVASAKAPETIKATVDAKRVAAAVAEPVPAPNGFEVAFVPSPVVWDGRFANNGWLQETPDPMTKLVWGNAALISPGSASQANFKDGDIVTLGRGDYKLDVAIMIQPGHADQAVTIALGYGRAKCGRVGKDVGFNAYQIRTSTGMSYQAGFALTGTDKKHRHATTQEHGAAETQNDRPIVREASIESYKKNPKLVEEMAEVPELQSIYPERVYNTGYQWGMAIDLSTCTGCNACVVACTSENNIPVVGKDQVLRGREMHWIRMDRYYTGTADDPQAVLQPLPCMQCENAPCENVCPVAATTHSPEGLSDMAYNRCVGTRYCANNCPFKVRHFNFLNFHKNDPEVLSLVHNPDVSVRMRGVMEKCTYCVQRIQETKIKAKAEGRRAIPDGEIKTACQQTCPADAIVFGNINDPNSRVSKLKKQERNYAMLAELDIRPRTTYLAKLRNPNPELANV